MSEEVEGFMSRRIVELSGSDKKGRQLRYEELKTRHNKLVQSVAKKKEVLSELPYFHEANDLLAGLGLKKDFSNADELIPKLRKEWKGSAEFIHEYISLVELARDKHVVERELDHFYSQSSSSDSETSPTPVSSQPPPPPPSCTAIIPVQN